MRVALIVLPGAGREAGTQERQHLVSAMSCWVRAVWEAARVTAAAALREGVITTVL